MHYKRYKVVSFWSIWAGYWSVSLVVICQLFLSNYTSKMLFRHVKKNLICIEAAFGLFLWLLYCFAGGMMGGMPPRMGMRPPGPPGPFNMPFRPGPGMQGPPQMRGGYWVLLHVSCWLSLTLFLACTCVQVIKMFVVNEGMFGKRKVLWMWRKRKWFMSEMLWNAADYYDAIWENLSMILAE